MDKEKDFVILFDDAAQRIKAQNERDMRYGDHYLSLNFPYDIEEFYEGSTPLPEEEEVDESSLGEWIEKDSKWGLVDEWGRMIIPCKWADVGCFCGGLCPVADDNGKWGYIDLHGKVVIPLQYDYAFDFCHKYATVWNKSTGEFMIDKSGRRVDVPCCKEEEQEDHQKEDPKDSTSIASESNADLQIQILLDEVKKEEATADRKKQQEQFSIIQDNNERYGIKDNSANKDIVPCQWRKCDWILFQYQKIVTYCDDNGLWGLYNVQKNKMLTPCHYIEIQNYGSSLDYYKGGFLVAYGKDANGIWHDIDEFGDEVREHIPPRLKVLIND